MFDGDVGSLEGIDLAIAHLEQLRLADVVTEDYPSDSLPW